jgi:hypothetical protein
MKNPSRFLGAVLFLGMTMLARASDPIGIYALVDRVVLEPDAASAERIQIWGAFALATGRGEEYAEPATGFMYFSLPEKKAETARKEWADLKKLAGTGKCLAFAGRYQEKGKVRRSEESAKRPDVYPIAQGVTEVRAKTEYPPIKALSSLPVPLSPADGAEAVVGSVMLKVRATAENEPTGAKCYFEIEGPAKEKEASPGVVPSGNEASWSPAMKVEPGKKYIWRAWTADGKRKGPVRLAVFQGKP